MNPFSTNPGCAASAAADGELAPNPGAHRDSKRIVKIIVVPNKLVNFVIR
jgi:hypothetical protein